MPESKPAVHTDPATKAARQLRMRIHNLTDDCRRTCPDRKPGSHVGTCSHAYDNGKWLDSVAAEDAEIIREAYAKQTNSHDALVQALRLIEEPLAAGGKIDKHSIPLQTGGKRITYLSIIRRALALAEEQAQP